MSPWTAGGLAAGMHSLAVQVVNRSCASPLAGWSGTVLAGPGPGARR